MPCISFTEASVDLQHSEIICLTDASVKWPQRCNEDYCSGKSDMHERRRRGVHHCISRKSLAQSQKSACVY
jgi:hypothetical protein